MQRQSRAGRTRARRGNYAFTAVSAVVLLGFGSLVVDIGRARMVKAELQNAADAASMAGVYQLDATDAGLEAAVETAVAFANANLAENRPVEITVDDVVLGIWDRDTSSFTPSTSAADVNAVRVLARRDDVATFLAPAAFGVSSLGAGAGSIAYDPPIVPAGGVGCYLPFAIPSCMVDQGDETLRDVVLKVNPPGSDNVGWARPNDSPNADFAADAFRDCGRAGEAAVGDPVFLAEGAMTTALVALKEEIEASATTWDPTAFGAMPEQMALSSVNPGAYGRTVEGPIMVFEGGPGYCDGTTSFGGSEPLVGFVWAAAYDVTTNGAISDRTVQMRLDLAREHVMGTKEGDLDVGVLYDPPPVYVR